MGLGVCGLIVTAIGALFSGIVKMAEILWESSYGRASLIVLGISIFWCFVRKKQMREMFNSDSDSN
jgi:hypothetical protein